MLSTALGATTAIWLLLAPLLGLQSDARSRVAVAVGVAALVLSALSNWRRGPGAALAVLGLGLALVNFVLPGSVGSLADFATCGAALIIAGIAPGPESVARVVTIAPAVAREPDIDESETPTRRLQRAA